jgi:hypothetical protein
MPHKITHKLNSKGIPTTASKLIKQDWGLITIFSGVCFSFYFAMGAAAEIPSPLPTTPLVLAQGQLFNPKFAGFDPQPRGCDIRGINGWFYWYRHDLNRCTVVLAGNQADATFKAVELAASTEVIEAGIGYRLIGDPIF